MAIATSIGKSPSQFHLRETERRNESSIFSSRSPTFPLINHYLINEIVLFSGFEFCWQLSYERLISICVFLIVIVLINVDVIMNESVRVVIILGGVVVEDAVVAIISL